MCLCLCLDCRMYVSRGFLGNRCGRRWYEIHDSDCLRMDPSWSFIGDTEVEPEALIRGKNVGVLGCLR